jgi:hypothetical protein
MMRDSSVAAPGWDGGADLAAPGVQFREGLAEDLIMNELMSRLPKHDGLFWPVVQALKGMGGPADNQQLVERVSEILSLADELTAIPHKSGLQSEIAWVSRRSWSKKYQSSAAFLLRFEQGRGCARLLGSRGGNHDLRDGGVAAGLWDCHGYNFAMAAGRGAN